MAKILSSTKFNGNVSKMIETPDGYIINGQMYDKSSLTAKALDFCPINVNPKNEMMMYKNVSLDYNWVHNRVEQGVIADNVDPNTFYIVANGRYSVSGNFFKVTKNAAGYTVIPSSSGLTNWELMDYISQDTNRIYVMMQRSVSDSYAYFGYLDKATMTLSWTNLGAMTTLRILKETDGAIYFSAHFIRRLMVYKYNKASSSIGVLYDETLNASAYNYRALASTMDEYGQFYAVYDTYNALDPTHRTGYRKYTLDTSKDSVSVADCSVDLSIKPGTNAGLAFGGVGVNGNDACKHEMFMIKDGGKTYLTHVCYNNGTVATNLPLDKCSLHTYEVVSPTQLKLVSYTDFSPILYRGMMNMYDNRLLVLGYEGGVHFFNWNSGKPGFDKTGAFDAQVFSFGCDTNNNIFVQSQDSGVEMLSNLLPTAIYADFEKDTYKYNGADVDAVIEVYAKNFSNQFLSTNLELSLSGPVRFADTGLKKKTVATSNLNKLSIPVIISGEGLLKVNNRII